MKFNGGPKTGLIECKYRAEAIDYSWFFDYYKKQCESNEQSSVPKLQMKNQQMKLQIKALKKLRRLIISHYWMKCGLIPVIVLIFIPSNMRKLYKKAISLLLLWKLFLIPKACSSLLVRILIFLHLQISFEKCKYYYEIRKTRKGSLFIEDFIKNASKWEAATKKRPWE